MATIAVIFGMGDGLGMKSRRPLALHELCGRAVLEYVVRACFEAGCQRAVVAGGQGAEEMMAQFSSDTRLDWAEHCGEGGVMGAIRSCQKQLKGRSQTVMAVPGNAPLIRSQVLRVLLEAHREEHADLTFGTAMVEDAGGYARVVRDEQGKLLKVVEAEDGTAEQREILPGYCCLRGGEVLSVLWKGNGSRGGRELGSGEVVEIMRQAGKKAVAVQVLSGEDVFAVQTRGQLAAADGMMEERIQRQLLEEGVSIVSGVSTYVEAGVTVGRETVIRPFSFIGRDCSIGGHCTIGPFAMVPRESIVPEGTTIAGNISVETALLNRTGS